MFSHNGTNEVISVARAGSAFCSKSDGSLVLLGNNLPRVEAFGLRINKAATNLITDPRDLTTANWTRTSVTAARVTGADGVASSGTTLTATGTNGTALQAVTSASSLKSTAMFVKRRTGVGAVSVTRDNTTFTDISASLSTTTWRRVQSDCRNNGAAYDVTGIPNCIEVANLTATSTNPTVGFRLATSGDAIDVDIVQLEAGGYSTSPINGATRVAEVVTTSTTGVPFAAAELMVDAVYEFTAGSDTNGSFIVDTSNNLAGCGVSHGMNVTNSVLYTRFTHSVSGTTSIVGLLNGLGIGAQFNQRWVWASGSAYVYLNGIGPPTILDPPRVVGTAFMPNCHTAIVYGSVVGTSFLDGWLTRVRWRTVASTSFTGKAIVLFGDSIVDGTLLGAADRPPRTVQVAIGGFAAEKYVTSTATAGYTIDQCKTQWDGVLAGVVAQGTQARTTFVLQCGVNSLADGCPSVSGKITTMLTDAKTAGVTVVPATITPTSGSAVVTCINAAIAVWAASNSVSMADTNTPLNDGAGNLAAAYSIDGLHPNAAGSAIMTQRWINAGAL